MSNRTPGATNLLEDQSGGFATDLFSGDIERNARKFELSQQRLEEMHADIRAVGCTPEGRRLLGAILQRCHLYQNSFTGNAWVGIYEGERLVGQWPLANIAAASGELLESVMLDDLRALNRAQRETPPEGGE